MNAFCRYQLRTTDLDSARRFYTALFGARFWRDGIDNSTLPAQAAARGAPAHWLGHIAVGDVQRSTEAFERAGAVRLGPPSGNSVESVILRDPFGAIVALTPGPAPRTSGVVAWHLLNTKDEETAMALYAGVLGWTRLGAHDLGARGRHVTFAWSAQLPPAGSTSNLAGLPHVHPQWLYFFLTEDIEQSLERVRGLGGIPLPAAEAANGDLVAACDDPQGAAFGLYQPRPRT